jgi:hypothetical protein
MPSHTRSLSRRTLLRAAAAAPLAAAFARARRAHAAHPSAPPPILTAAPTDPESERRANGIRVVVPGDIGADEAWAAVNLTVQAAVAMVGTEAAHVALVTTGKPGWDTPEGEFRIVRRVANETMSSAALAITDPDDQYYLTDVLYTQYFTWAGHALHLNYWRPDRVFGAERTSHGCVGMRLADAEFFWHHLRLGSRVVIHA